MTAPAPAPSGASAQPVISLSEIRERLVALGKTRGSLTYTEIESCKPYLLRQLALVKPKIIVVLGRVAAQALLNTNEPIGKLRGQIRALNGTPLVVVYHPAYLLRSLLDKRKAWADLKLAMQTVKHIKG